VISRGASFAGWSAAGRRGQRGRGGEGMWEGRSGRKTMAQGTDARRARIASESARATDED
jgi:hypothetical protein